MNPNLDTSSSDLVALEMSIAETRAALERKIEELERRFTPAHIKDRVTRTLDPEPYLGWIAASAIAIGSVLAARGLRRRRRMSEDVFGYSGCTVR